MYAVIVSVYVFTAVNYDCKIFMWLCHERELKNQNQNGLNDWIKLTWQADLIDTSLQAGLQTGSDGAG
jgi:hypothetical protein